MGPSLHCLLAVNPLSVGPTLAAKGSTFGLHPLVVVDWTGLSLRWPLLALKQSVVSSVAFINASHPQPLALSSLVA